MRVVRMAIRAVVAMKVMVTRITGLGRIPVLASAAQIGAESPITPPRLAGASPEPRRAMRTSGRPQPIALIRPQYLPELARARSLRLRVGHRPMATPVEITSLSDLRWRRALRVRSR